MSVKRLLAVLLIWDLIYSVQRLHREMDYVRHWAEFLYTQVNRHADTSQWNDRPSRFNAATGATP